LGSGYTAIRTLKEIKFMLSRVQNRLRDLSSRIDDRFYPYIIGGAIVVAILWFLGQGAAGTDVQVIQLTIDAAATQRNLDLPTLAANLTATPPDAVLTAAAPTVALAGRNSVDQFAASGSATSQLGEVDYSASQAAGPPNTPTCGEYGSAWAPANTGSQEALTLLFAELVYPTGLLVYQSNNPGAISSIVITDYLGENHTVYQSPPQPGGSCPAILTIQIPDADYPSNSITIFFDQSLSGGRTQIDAVQLLGIRY
jgi:hypothetical protein